MNAPSQTRDRRSPFLQALRARLHGEVLDDATQRGIYATDASVYQITPLAIALPRDEEDVLAALALAAEHGVAVLPRGGGTSLAGQTVAEALVLDFSKYMNRILELNVEERWVRVQPGLVRDELNRALAPHGLHFAPDPATSSRATVGGMVGNNSSGTKSILYGKTVDHLRAARVALADGTVLDLSAHEPDAYAAVADQPTREGAIYRGFRELIFRHSAEIEARFPKVMRRVGGYNFDAFTQTETWNLAKLICGSEGTLATTLELELHLEPLPAFTSVAALHFSTVPEAISAVGDILAFQPAAVEILDSHVLERARANLLTQRHCQFLEGHPAAILVVEFYGDSPTDVLERPAAMEAALRRRGLGYAFPVFAGGSQAYEDVWIVRKKGLGLMLGMKGRKKPLPFIEDAGIPVDVLPAYIDEVLALCRKHQTEAAMYAHASVGVIHVRPILDLRDPQDIRRFVAIAEGTFELVRKYGGSWSGEHGDGLVRSPFNERFFGSNLYEAFREVKALFDPEWRMNPGKIVGAPPMDQHLRYGSGYRDRSLDSVYHYREDGSFAEAVHMCTGVGECRKLQGGSMCPSYRATRDEAHSTRGRANALRLAMSGQLGERGLLDEGLFQALDLCLSCKACKSECPSNVDMAKLKSEIWQQRYDAEGAGLRDRLIARSAEAAARLCGPLAPVVNAVQRSVPFRWLLERTAGIDRRRRLPDYATRSFASWWEAERRPPVSGRQGRVVLFADTYLNYHEPGIGRSAASLLEGLGYAVEVAAGMCCQRPRISHGFLRQAKAKGTATAERLDHWLRQDIPILVCEPSCASALTDDLPDLLDDAQLAARLQAGVGMIDSWLAGEMEAGRLEAEAFPQGVPASSKPAKTWVHGHCHQKALFGTERMLRLLAMGGHRPVEIPSGCCGMAGSFGYEREHMALSEKIGKEVLFPALADLPENAEVVACGVSCRHQIQHFTGRRARHWVEIMVGNYRP